MNGHTETRHAFLSPTTAALNGHAGVVRELVAAGCDIDAQSQNGSSALHNAASGAAPSCQPCCLGLLLGLVCRVRGHPAAAGDLPCCIPTCQLATLPSAHPLSPTAPASTGGHTEVVEVLLAAGGDCDVQNSNGNTPLHLSAGEAGGAGVHRTVCQDTACTCCCCALNGMPWQPQMCT